MKIGDKVVHKNINLYGIILGFEKFSTDPFSENNDVFVEFTKDNGEIERFSLIQDLVSVVDD